MELRREDVGESEKWMHQARVMRRHRKRTQTLFKTQTQHSFRELAATQENYCAKHDLGLATKSINAVHTQRIGYIVGVNM